jgi:hypothetical protein
MKYIYSLLVGIAFVIIAWSASFIVFTAWLFHTVFPPRPGPGPQPEVGWDMITMWHNMSYLDVILFLFINGLVFAFGFFWNLRRLSKIPSSAL